MIDPLLLEEYTEGIRRSRQAYWREQHGETTYAKKLREADKVRRYKARKKAERDGAA